MPLFPRKIRDPNSHYTRIVKPMYQYMWFKKGVRLPVFILGAQNSGANQLARVFQSMPSCRVFSEIDSLSSSDKLNTLRMNPFGLVGAELRGVHAPLAITLPLVESHRANEILKDIKNARIVWLYRHYIDFAILDLHNFKNTAGRGNLMPIIRDEPNNWRNEGVSTGIRETLRSVYKNTHSEFECACLFWYARNRLAFEQSLDSNKSVLFLSHEQLRSHTEYTLSQLMFHLGLDVKIPSSSKRAFNNDDSLLVNKKQKIDPIIKTLCEHLYKKMSTTLNNVRYRARELHRADGKSEIRRVAAMAGLNALSQVRKTKNKQVETSNGATHSLRTNIEKDGSCKEEREHLSTWA